MNKSYEAIIELLSYHIYKSGTMDPALKSWPILNNFIYYLSNCVYVSDLHSDNLCSSRNYMSMSKLNLGYDHWLPLFSQHFI